MSKHLPLDDFRAIRTVLEEDDYALSSGTPEPTPSDLISEDTWLHLTVLPDEVAVRTSNRHGTLLDILNQLAGTWPVCVGDSEHPDPVGLAMIEVINEPDASLYNMLVGFYRQAIDSLRVINTITSPKCAFMCHESKLAKICASFSGHSWPCFMTFVPFCLSRCLWIGSFDLEKVAAAFPAMIGGKKGLQDHIMTLTQPR